MNGMFADRRGWVMLFFPPLAFFAAEWVLRSHATPYWLWFNTDNYLYLLSGMNLLEGVPLAAYQHPGAPLSVLTALSIWLSGAGSPGAVADTAFTGAEALMTHVSTAMLALDAGALWSWVMSRGGVAAR